MNIIDEKRSVKVDGQYFNKLEYCVVENYEMPELPASNPSNGHSHTRDLPPITITFSKAALKITSTLWKA